MLNTTQITIAGNIGHDPELRYTPTGAAVASFNVAVPQRRYDRETRAWEDTGTTWYRVNAWRDLAEHVAESLRRGNRVIVVGSLAAREWEDRDGNKRESWEVTADAVGADLAYATVTIKRAARDTVPVPDDPWAGSASGEPDSGQESPAAGGSRSHAAGASEPAAARTEPGSGPGAGNTGSGPASGPEPGSDGPAAGGSRSRAAGARKPAAGRP